MKTITLELRPEDAEPILREAAETAAKYSAWCDYITLRTYNGPSRRGAGISLADAKVDWRRRFLRAKRIVEAFGAEYEQTSEPETLTIHIPHKVLKETPVRVAGISFSRVDKWRDDPKNAVPEYRREVHDEACRHAADRVVRRWRALLDESRIAA